MTEAQAMPNDNGNARSWEAALEEAINMIEQGENMDPARFAELVETLNHQQAEAEIPEEDPRHQMLAALRERASALEASAAEGTGPTDQISSLLGGLVGQPAHTDAPAIVEIEGQSED